MEQFEGRVAVVTGAASGIGLGLAHRAAAEGMSVVMADVEPEALARAAGEVASGGAEVLAVTCDVTDEGSVAELARRVSEAHGACDLLFNNAGVSAGGPMWEVSEADWDWVIGVNLLGVARCIRHLVPPMITEGGGHVVNTASMAGLSAMPSTGPYSASKHAVVSMSEILAHDLALAGADVGVSVLCPGWVVTGLMESDRNRPGGPRDEEPDSEPSPEQEAFRDAVRSAFESGISPAEVAITVFEAVREGRFWILTHEDWNRVAEVRCRDILEGRAPTLELWPI